MTLKRVLKSSRVGNLPPSQAQQKALQFPYPQHGVGLEPSSQFGGQSFPMRTSHAEQVDEDLQQSAVATLTMEARVMIWMISQKTRMVMGLMPSNVFCREGSRWLDVRKCPVLIPCM